MLLLPQTQTGGRRCQGGRHLQASEGNGPFVEVGRRLVRPAYFRKQAGNAISCNCTIHSPQSPSTRQAPHRGRPQRSSKHQALAAAKDEGFSGPSPGGKAFGSQTLAAHSLLPPKKTLVSSDPAPAANGTRRRTL
jgi:hypothetical protein